MDGQQERWPGMCSTCGLLCVAEQGKPSRANQLFFEASDASRSSGGLYLYMYPEGNRTIHAQCNPRCFVGAADILREIHVEAGRLGQPVKENKEAAIKIIRSNRKCPHWIAYQPGLGPQWHYGKRLMERIFSQMDADNVRRDREQRVQFWIMGGMVFAQVMMGLAALIVSIIGVLLVLWLR